METTNSIDKEKISNLDNFICITYGQDVINYFKENLVHVRNEKNISVGEWAKFINEDDHLRLLFACTNHRTLKHIHFWIKLWSVLTIIGIILYFIISIMNYS